MFILSKEYKMGKISDCIEDKSTFRPYQNKWMN